ncbi:hypothetical protein CPSG_04265 [Coccidioides posadasii str. Silveira]|uniref:Uncharacterized protein n=1 Tax=Coccidioides posadasii (strain RMSCC 757 / Silveira) TaxID=443226 RepID=E9D3S6_COCPS|nr:hypothetical protein CPSG_04265 [Coccidioides posadasii str. Silveira]
MFVMIPASYSVLLGFSNYARQRWLMKRELVPTASQVGSQRLGERVGEPHIASWIYYLEYGVQRIFRRTTHFTRATVRSKIAVPRPTWHAPNLGCGQTPKRPQTSPFHGIIEEVFRGLRSMMVNDMMYPVLCRLLPLLWRDALEASGSEHMMILADTASCGVSYEIRSCDHHPCAAKPPRLLIASRSKLSRDSGR